MRNQRVSLRILSILLVGIFCSAAWAQDRLIITPRDGHDPFITAIDSAKKKVELIMFHLSDRVVIESLKSAQTRGVDVRVILDQNIAGKSQSAPGIIKDMQSKGVTVQLSSPAFSITHEKSMLVDDATLFITSINLATIVAKTRDFGVITADRDVIDEYQKFFDADWTNAQAGTDVSPVGGTRLVWSPGTSADRLVQFIASAKKSVHIEIENLGAVEIQGALLAAAKSGVEVKVLVSECGMGDPNRNEPFLDELGTGGVQVFMMTGPATPAKPYIHAKVIVADGEKFFVGSENFSYNSLIKAREVGIISADATMAKELASTISGDFAIADLRKVGAKAVCPKLF